MLGKNAPTWTRQVRTGYDIYRDYLNTPAFLAMLPDISGQKGLDIGCGEGGNTRKLAERGAKIHGVDIASAFIKFASETESQQPLGICYQMADARRLPFADGEFDFATAFMSLMDVMGPEIALKEIARILRPGGFLQFSILHPCFAPPHRKVLRDKNGIAYAIEIADYFAIGEHAETWHFSSVGCKEKENIEPFHIPYTHLTLTGWLDAIAASGLVLEKTAEPRAMAETAQAVPDVADTLIAPLFLHVRARKPSNQ